jgi:NTP pyrophosphatase (non-canonical NTP hydrolase)
MDFVEFQRSIEETYGELDRERGIPGTVAWLVEELGELAQAARKLGREEQLLELSDVLAWVTTLASLLGLSIDEAAQRYADGCPHCGNKPCTCPRVRAV